MDLPSNYADIELGFLTQHLRARKEEKDARIAEVMREVREDCIREWSQTIPGFNAERAMRRG